MEQDPLRDQLEQDYERAMKGFPERWDPEEPGDKIIGELKTMDYNIQTQYGPVDVATIHSEDLDEARCVWLARTVLKNEWDEQNPAPGERVGVIYLGMDDENDYHRYSVRVDRATEGRDNRLQPARNQPSGGGPADDDGEETIIPITDSTQNDVRDQANQLADVSDLDNTPDDWIHTAAKNCGFEGPLADLDEQTGQEMYKWLKQHYEDAITPDNVPPEDETEDDIPF